jgi:hypothetical protein
MKASSFRLVSCLGHSPTLKMEATHFIKTLVDFQQTTQCCIPEDRESSSYRYHNYSHNVRWVAVTTAWRVLRLEIEERPPARRVAANILNKQQ